MSADTQFQILMALAVSLGTWGLFHIVIGLLRSDEDRIQQRLAARSMEELAILNRPIAQKESQALPPVLARFDVVRKLAMMVRQAWPDANVARFLLSIPLSALAGALLGWRLMGIPLGVPILGGIGGAIPLLVARTARNRRQQVLMEQLIEALDFLARILRAGHSLGTGFQMISEELPDPIATEFRLVYQQNNLGRPLDETLTEMATRVASTEFAFFVTSVLIQRQTGGDLAAILDNLASTIRGRVQFKQQLSARTAEGRITGYILAAMPLVCLALSNLLNPQYTNVLWTTSPGRTALVIAFGLQVIGLVVIRKIVNFES